MTLPRIPDSERTPAFTDPVRLTQTAAIFRRARARRLAREAAEAEEQQEKVS